MMIESGLWESIAVSILGLTTSQDDVLADDPLASGARLAIDLAAVAYNYRLIEAKVGATVAAVVKADAYGLGMAPVALALAGAGCRDFFVAHLQEALALRREAPLEARIYVLHGLWPGAERAAADEGVIPVLNSLGQMQAWRRLARQRGQRLPAVLQVDTGMSRLGMSRHEVDWLTADPEIFSDLDIRLLMSHLACADHPDAAGNARQRAAFTDVIARLPPVDQSFANSAAALSARPSFGGLVRAGLALFGASPVPGEDFGLRPVVRLEARVLQCRSICAGDGVGYGHTFIASEAMRIATVAMGYADGWPRGLDGRAAAYFGDQRLPVLGRVSMDSFVVDASGLEPGALRAGDWVELIGRHQSVEDIATAAGAIPYEILVNLGPRLQRWYAPADAPSLDRTN